MFPLRKGRPNWRAQADARQGHEKLPGWMGVGAAFSSPCGRAQDMTEASDEEAQHGRERQRSCGQRERAEQHCRAGRAGRAAALRCSLPGGDWGGSCSAEGGADSVAGHGEAREPDARPGPST